MTAAETLALELDAQDYDTTRTRVYLLKSVNVLTTCIENARLDLHNAARLPENDNVLGGRAHMLKELVHYVDNRATIRAALELLDCITGASK